VLVAPREIIEQAQALAGGRPLQVVGAFAGHNINRGGRFQDMLVATRPADSE